MMKEFKNIGFQAGLPFETDWGDVHIVTRSLEVQYPPTEWNYAGFDPGQTNMGVAWFGKGKGAVYQLRFPSKLGSLDRIHLTYLAMLKVLTDLPNSVAKLVVENASFGSPFGQAALSENRTMILHTLDLEGLDVVTVPPLSIRKRVFGSAKIKAEELWPELAHGRHNDGASALACAVCAYLLHIENENG